ncbi:MAG: poly(A) polymerase [Labilithrix sp.]|nr:poly(A) polymerase [Labilithrix sp.]
MSLIHDHFLVPTAPDFSVDWSALDERFDWIRAMKGTPQDPIHHAEGDVWIHTRLVAEAMAKLDAFRALDDGQLQAVAFAAALLHDVGKPGSTQIGEDGRVTAKGHSTKGAALARQILWRANVPFDVRETCVGLVRHHQAPFWLLEREDPFELVARISQTTRCDLLALLAESDARGRTCDDPQRILDNVALFVEYCRERGCLDGPIAFPSDHARVLWFAGRQGDPTFAPHEDFRSEVVLMSGFPGAGKDRWIAEHAADWPVVSLDRLREELDVDPTSGQGAIIQQARENARAHLRAGRSFVWNATNLSRRIRGQCLRLFADYGARIRIVYIEVPEATLHAQNRSRRSPVPANVLESLVARWEVPDTTEAHEVTYVVTHDT